MHNDQRLSYAIHTWTFDDVTDIKDLQGDTWAEVSGSLTQITGVRGGAVKLSGGAGPIRLSTDIKIGLTDSTVTLSLWLLYQSKGVPQTFLTAGRQEPGYTGIHLHQHDGNKDELTFSIKNRKESCSFKFKAPQRVWTQLVFTWKKESVVSTTKLYRNGKRIADAAQNCVSGSFPFNADSEIRLGSSQLPLASLDDIIVWEEELTEVSVERMYRFYKGK